MKSDNEVQEPRHRATAIIIKDDCILLMHRNNNGREYYAFIGGGIEEGESPLGAMLREVKEETSLIVKPVRQLYEIRRSNAETHYVFLCDYVSGEPIVQKGTREYESNIFGENTHMPEWVKTKQLQGLTIYPDIIKHHLLNDLQHGFPAKIRVIETD